MIRRENRRLWTCDRIYGCGKCCYIVLFYNVSKAMTFGTHSLALFFQGLVCPESLSRNCATLSA